LTFLFLFLSGPLILLRLAALHPSSAEFEPARDIFSLLPVVFMSALFILPSLVLSNVLFGYLYQTKMTAGIHGLPPSRLALYVNQCVSGLIMLYIPLILNALILLMIRWSLPETLGVLYAAGHVAQWLGIALLMASLMFFIGVFVGMMTGWAQAQLIFALIFHGLPAALYVLTSAALSHIVFGYPFLDQFPSWMGFLPIAKAVAAAQAGLPLSQAAIYLAAALVFAGLGFLGYHHRPLETAGDLITFAWLKPVFKYGFAYCATLSGALSVSGIANIRLSLPLLFFWLLIGYAAAEMLLQKSLYILKAWKGALVALCVAGLCFLGLKTNLLGYENRVPAGEEIESVCLTSNYNLYERYEKLRLAGSETEPADKSYINVNDLNNMLSVSREPANIQNAAAWHRQILSDKTRIQGADHSPEISYTRNFHVIYQLTNGRRLFRSYLIDFTDYQSYLAPLYKSMEFKRQNYPILTQSPQDFPLAAFTHDRRQAVDLAIPPDQIPGLVQALQKDIQNISMPLPGDWGDPGYTNVILYKNASMVQPFEEQRFQYAIHPGFQTTLQWLEDHDYPVSPPTSAQIKEIRLFSMTGASTVYPQPAAVTEDLPAAPLDLVITDPDIIDAVLLDDSYHRERENYRINPFGQNDFAFRLYFTGWDANGNVLSFEGGYDRGQPLPPALQAFLYPE
jgi:ABC-2 type transport system permease protein